jgi:hypothetical protein
MKAGIQRGKLWKAWIVEHDEVRTTVGGAVVEKRKGEREEERLREVCLQAASAAECRRVHQTRVAD